MEKNISWTRFLTVSGYIAMLVGAFDPLEGSLLILPGSALVAYGTYKSRGKNLKFRIWDFIAILFGFSAMWYFSSLGGFGGDTGRSFWLALLTLPLFIGWSVGIWGPDSPRWVLWLGCLVGGWYMVILVIALRGGLGGNTPEMLIAPIALTIIGLITIIGCIYRLRSRLSLS